MTATEDQYWAELAATVEADLLTRIPENKLRPRLEPTRRAVELLGDPQKSYRVIHVTGTNGKTSTTRFIERILREYGLRTGRFTSPHLVSLNERMSIDGEPVSDERLYSVWQDIKPILEIVDAELEAAGDTKLTFFEALAALGFAVFADAPVDVLVLEVGMGGTWDSTNVADGDVAVFTPIDLDHMERLGNTIAEIATTKAGIIKPNAIVVSSPQTIEAEEVLVRTSAEIADAFALLGSQFEVTSKSIDGFGQRFTVQGLAGTYENLFLPLLGEYQVENAAVAIAAVEAFLGGGQHPITDDVLRVALADASSPGRLQVVSRDPLVILDAAHNPQGASALAGALAGNFPGKEFIGVFSVLAEKDAKGIFSNLATVLSDVVITQSSSPRAIPAEELAEIAGLYFAEDQIRVIQSPAAAYAWATELAQDIEAGAVVVSGSISLVGDILKIQQKALESDD
ncbi:MAG: bifunctional folylpolyglutamate synthase/dihydrofolate synthase [Micrococcales bacterium]